VEQTAKRHRDDDNHSDDARIATALHCAARPISVTADPIRANRAASVGKKSMSEQHRTHSFQIKRVASCCHDVCMVILRRRL
jgi:hypothetical protein